MCGIVGIHDLSGEVEALRARVTAAVRVLQHRGPDDEGVEIVAGGGAMDDRRKAEESRLDADGLLPGADGGPVVVFGHRRLSILDLSSAGHQPMRDSGTGNWITYNGEIYNFRELRAELENRGHRFRSHCDTEVILKAYAEWDMGCWRKLRGIFAFALWDARHRELHLVRDHLGVKPLYFAANSRGFTFASEVRAVLAAGGAEPRLSADGLRSFLKYGSVQEPVTMIEGVESLGAGAYLTRTADGTTRIRHFWRPEEALVRNWERPPAEGDVLAQLQDSIGRQLIADVPVGVFLSGGIDSTAVAALAARAKPDGVRTFCIGTDEQESDESAEAAATAAALGCEHASLILEGSVVRERLPAALRSYDQPSYDGINTYFISMLVRQAGIKVALSGLGGDELFIGYGGFAKALKYERMNSWFSLLPDGCRDWLSRGIGGMSSPGVAAPGAVSELLSPDLPAPYFATRILFSRYGTNDLLTPSWQARAREVKWQVRESSLARAASSLSPLDRVSFFELQTYMISTLLRDADQMSMAHGMELRVPLIDPEVVEHVLPIPATDKLRDGSNKRLLWEALRGLVPAEVFARKKRGFLLPFRRWLAEDLQEMVEACFLSAQPRGPWNLQQLRRVWTDFKRGRVTWSRVLPLFILENWMEQNGVAV